MKKRKTLTSDYIDLGSGIPVYGYKSKSISEGTDLSLKIQGKKNQNRIMSILDQVESGMESNKLLKSWEKCSTTRES